MTQHAMLQDSQEDIRTMKSLRNFIGLFVAFAVALALGVAIFAP
jgi:hypothetical protein